MLDTSAILAIIFKEAEAEDFALRISRAEVTSVSAASLLETTVVLTRRTASRDDRDLRLFLAAQAFQVVPFDDEQSAIAREAYRRFGQGSGHSARLNFGDCFAYALAKTLNAPLLFKGDDFSHTDVRAA